MEVRMLRTKHGGLFDMATPAPDHWGGDIKPKPNWKVLSSPEVLTEDFCVMNGEKFFIRCRLPLPVIGTSDVAFGFNVWSSLSKQNFDLYFETFDGGKQGELGPWFGWFSNRLQGYPDTLNLKCFVHPQSNRMRPLIELERSEHPLAVEQREGITFDRILEIYALYGHDIRPALMD
jgi:hypothetical protein